MTTEFFPAGSCHGPGSPASETLQQDAERFRLLVENSLDLVVEVTLDGDIRYVSPNVSGVLGYTAEELVGTSAYSHVHPDDLADVRAHFAEAPPHQAICRYRHRDGSWRWLETTGRKYLTSSGAEPRVLIARDMTESRQAAAERRRLEEELCKAEKLISLGTLAGGVAHDFNNILTAIIAYTTLARMATTQPETLDALAQVLKAADRAKHLAQQILTFSTQHRQMRVAVNFSILVDEVLKLLRPTLPPNVEVVTDLRDEGGLVVADSTQIHQVLVNLVTNAVHALQPRPGRIEIRLAAFVADETLVQSRPALRAGRYLRLSVIDTGHGMDRATQQRIFEPLFTTKLPGEGTGLGLAVVHRIVTDHGGAIQVSSRPGEGTEFHLYFPRFSAPVQRSGLDPQLCGHGERVLFVDDEAHVCATVAKVLQAGNYRVTTHTDPRDAVNYFRAHSKEVDLVITDLAMPGLTGVDLAIEILKLCPQLPVLLVSGEFGRWTVDETRHLGIRGVVPKPLSLHSLLKATRDAIATARTPPTAEPAPVVSRPPLP